MFATVIVNRKTKLFDFELFDFVLFVKILLTKETEEETNQNSWETNSSFQLVLFFFLPPHALSQIRVFLSPA